MDRFDLIEDRYEFFSSKKTMNFDKLEQIDRVILLSHFNINRFVYDKIIKRMYTLHSKHDILNSIIEYENFNINGFKEHSVICLDIYEGDLFDLIEPYLIKEFNKIESHTLKLEL